MKEEKGLVFVYSSIIIMAATIAIVMLIDLTQTIITNKLVITFIFINIMFIIICAGIMFIKAWNELFKE